MFKYGIFCILLCFSNMVIKKPYDVGATCPKTVWAGLTSSHSILGFAILLYVCQTLLFSVTYIGFCIDRLLMDILYLRFLRVDRGVHIRDRHASGGHGHDGPWVRATLTRGHGRV